MKEQVSGRIQTACLAMALFAFSFFSACSGAQEGDGPSQDATQLGTSLYLDQCSACHGADAKGKGLLSTALMSVPADLTRIAERRNGHFPSEEIRRTIDGRSEFSGHRGLEMPRFAEYWDSSPAPGDIEAPEKIDAVVQYLSSIQRISPSMGSEDSRTTRERMVKLTKALENALPAVFSDAAFFDLESRDKLAVAVAELEKATSALNAHAKVQSKTFSPLAHSLDLDARRIRIAFDAAELRRTRYRFGDLLENCAACHMRLASERGSTLGTRLIGQIDRGSLRPNEDLRLLLATRQFETALDRYEKYFLDGKGAELGDRGLLVDYLITSLRVVEDSVRPRRTLLALLQGENAGGRNAELKAWVAALDALSQAGPTQNPIGRARDLLAKAEEMRREADSGASLIYEIAASGMLLRHIESDSLPAEELADTYYLLGITEERIRRPLGRERWDDYLEAAIRLAPGTPTSRAAFQRFEEILLTEHAGRSVLTFPRDEARRLEALRKIALEDET